MKYYEHDEVVEHKDEIVAKTIEWLKAENTKCIDEHDPQSGLDAFILYVESENKFYSFYEQEGKEGFAHREMDLNDPYELELLRDYVCANDGEDEEEEPEVDGKVDYKGDDREISMEDIEKALCERYGWSEYDKTAGCNTWESGWLSIKEVLETIERYIQAALNV